MKDNSKSARFNQQQNGIDAWFEKQKELVQKKEELGFGSEISLEEFSSILPHEEDGQAVKSQILALQKEIREHRQIGELLFVEKNVTEELNKNHAVVRLEQTYILTEKENDLFGGMDFILESRQSFRLFYENEIIQLHGGKSRSKADVWLKSPNRRTFSGIVFDPGHVGHINGKYNIWKGFSVKPIQGDCSLYWAHVHDNICSGDLVAYTFVRKWIAYVFQHPNVVHTALVILGSQGVGKNMFVDPLGFLFGPHYIKLSNLSELLSHFNAHLKNGVLINANEALWGGNKKETGALKAIVTESTFLCEAKGKDAIQFSNYRHLIITSNEEWPVDLNADDRRFFVLPVSEAHKEDHLYFEAIQNQLENGGYAALLFDLLNEDLTGFNPRSFPKSKGAFDIKLRSADSPDRYIYYVLKEEHFFVGEQHENKEWEDICKSHIFEFYQVWCRNNSEKDVSANIFHKRLAKLIPSIKTNRPLINGKRQRQYLVPSLDEARKEFSKAYKSDDEIWKDDDDDNLVSI